MIYYGKLTQQQYSDNVLIETKPKPRVSYDERFLTKHSNARVVINPELHGELLRSQGMKPDDISSLNYRIGSLKFKEGEYVKKRNVININPRISIDIFNKGEQDEANRRLRYIDLHESNHAIEARLKPDLVRRDELIRLGSTLFVVGMAVAPITLMEMQLYRMGLFQDPIRQTLITFSWNLWIIGLILIDNSYYNKLPDEIRCNHFAEQNSNDPQWKDLIKIEQK